MDTEIYTTEKLLNSRLSTEFYSAPQVNTMLSDLLTEAKGYVDETKHTHNNLAVLSGITAEKVAAWNVAETNAMDYTDRHIGAAIESLSSVYEPKGAESRAIASAESYTDSAIEELSTSSLLSVAQATGDEGTGILKTYTFYQGERQVVAINIPKDLVVQSGEIIVATAETGHDTVVGEKYLKLVIANQTDPLFIAVNDLVDAYTINPNYSGFTGNKARVALSVDSSNQFYAELTADYVTEPELSAVHDEITAINGSLANYALSTDVTRLTDNIHNELTADYAQITSNYALSADVTKTKSDIEAELTAGLQGIRDDLTAYAQKTDLTSYALSTDVDNKIAADLQTQYNTLHGELTALSDDVHDRIDSEINVLCANLSVTVEKQGTAESGYSSTYIVKQGGHEVGEKINIPLDMVVSSGAVKTVVEINKPYSGAAIGDKYIELTLANAAQDKIYIPVNDLVDKYVIATGSTNGTISVNGTDVAVKGLASAAYEETSAFDAAGAANEVSVGLIGQSTDLSSADTVNGAKAYAKEYTDAKIAEVSADTGDLENRVSALEDIHSAVSAITTVATDGSARTLDVINKLNEVIAALNAHLSASSGPETPTAPYNGPYYLAVNGSPITDHEVPDMLGYAPPLSNIQKDGGNLEWTVSDTRYWLHKDTDYLHLKMLASGGNLPITIAAIDYDTGAIQNLDSVIVTWTTEHEPI